MSFLNKFSKKSINKEIELEKFEEKEILEKIKNIKGIFYDEDEGILTVTEDLSEKRVRELLYWSKIHGYRDFADTLFDLFGKTHYKYFYKKAQYFLKTDVWASNRIKGGDIFSGGYNCPKFWLEWRTGLTILDKKMAIILKFRYKLPYLEKAINRSIEETMRKYVFEVYGEDKCSFIYKGPAVLKNKSSPFYLYLWQLLEEAQESLNKEIVFSGGFKIDSLKEKKFYPLEKPYLELCKLATDEERKAYEICHPEIVWLAKFKELLKETKIEKERIEINDKDSAVLSKERLTPDSKKPRIDFSVDNRTEIFPEELKKKIENVIKEKYKSKEYQIYVLLKYWLEFHFYEKDIHWLYGFIMFRSWRMKKQVKDYLKAFSQYVSFLKNLGTETNLWTIKERTTKHEDKYQSGHWILDNIGFSSNIVEAQKLCEEAKGSKDSLEKKAKLIRACSIYPDCLEGHLLLLNCWKEEGFKDIENEEAKKMTLFLEKKRSEYQAAYDAMINQWQQKEEPYWKEAKEIIQKIKKKLEQIKSSELILSKRYENERIFSPEEKDWREIKGLLIAAINNKDDRNKFNELSTRLVIQEMLKKVKYAILKEFHDLSRDDVQRRILNDFYFEISKIDRTKLNDFEGTKPFMKYLRKTLYHSVRNEIIQEKGLRNKTLPLRDDYSEEYPCT